MSNFPIGEHRPKRGLPWVRQKSADRVFSRETAEEIIERNSITITERSSVVAKRSDLGRQTFKTTSAQFFHIRFSDAFQLENSFVSSVSAFYNIFIWISKGYHQKYTFAAFSFVVALLYYSYFHFDHLHFHVTHIYAQLGHAPAQHAMGHKYLNGVGVQRNHTEAFKWFRKAADQGHPHSAYNLAVGHMQGYDTDIKKGEAHDLIKYAADQGVEEAHDVYHRVCKKGQCKH